MMAIGLAKIRFGNDTVLAIFSYNCPSMLENLVGILNFLGPVQTLLLVLTFIVAVVFFIGDWKWGKHGYDPEWLEERRKEIEREFLS